MFIDFTKRPEKRYDFDFIFCIRVCVCAFFSLKQYKAWSSTLSTLSLTTVYLIVSSRVRDLMCWPEFSQTTNFLYSEITKTTLWRRYRCRAVTTATYTNYCPEEEWVVKVERSSNTKFRMHFVLCRRRLMQIALVLNTVKTFLHQISYSLWLTDECAELKNIYIDVKEKNMR